MLSRLFRNLSQHGHTLEGLEPRSMLSADLAISVGTLKEGFDRTGNQNLKLPVTVVNAGDLPLQGGGSIDYFLSLDRTLDGSDFRFASTALPNVRGAGSSGTITLNTLKPALLAPRVGHAVPSGQYFIIAHVVTNRQGADSNTSNDTAATTSTIDINYAFGNVNGKPNVPLTVTMPNGNTVTFSLRGLGFGQVVNADGRIFVALQGTTTQSLFRIDPAKRNLGASISGLTVNGSLKELIADRIGVDGNVTISGAVGKVILGNIAHSTFQINGFGVDVSIQLGQVTDSSLTSRTPIRSLTVDRWRDTDLTPDTLSTPYIETLSSHGDFEAGVSTTTSHKGFSIKRLVTSGHISGTWSVRGSVNELQVGSIAADFTGTFRGVLNSVMVRGNAGGTFGSGNIKRMIVGGNLVGATYLAGASLGANGVLDGTSVDDTFTAAHIGLIEVRGQMINSNVAAGMQTTDGIIGNSDDQLASSGQIDTIIVKHGIINSHFITAHMPTRANVLFKNISTAGNSVFISG